MRTNQYFILLLTLSFLSSCGSKKDDANEVEVRLYPLVTLENAKVENFEHQITIQGNVETDQDILLNAEMGGLITGILVKEGQKVSKGQIVATVDAAILTSNMAEINTQLEYAEYMLGKQKELNKKGLGSEVELETAENRVNALKAQLNSVGTQKSKAVIRAPFSGTVDKVFAKTGQMAGMQSPILRLVNNSTVDITSDVSEKHLSKLHIGTPISVSFPNFVDTSIQVAITSIGNYIEPTNRTFRIQSTIKNNKLLLPNMLAELHITDLKVDNALVIPAQAILKAQDNSNYVYVAKTVKDNAYTLEKVKIDLIEKYMGSAYIADNAKIKDGSQIVVEGSRAVTIKDTVRIK